MHQSLCSMSATGYGGNTLFRMTLDAKECRKFSGMRMARLKSHRVFSAPFPKECNGSLFQREGLHICMPSKKPLTFMSCSTNSTQTENKQAAALQDSSKQIMKAVLYIALAAGLVALAGRRTAIASPQLVLPNAGSSSIAASRGKEILVSAWMGLMAGCLHTLTGPDHLAALAPLSIGRKKLESVAVGALWGCGHDAGQVIFGILFLILKGKLHIEVLRVWGSRVVGMTLVAIGIIGIREAQQAAVPCFATDGSVLSPDTLPSSDMSSSVLRKNLNFATFATGIVHGLQPDALIMILPALALPSRFAGAAFLIMFLLGTVLAMSGYTLFIGSCSQALKKRIPKITEHLSWISSAVAILVGVGILVGELFGLSIL